MIDSITTIEIIILIYGLLSSFIVGLYIIKNKWKIAIALSLIQAFIIGGLLFLMQIKQ